MPDTETLPNPADNAPKPKRKYVRHSLVRPRPVTPQPEKYEGMTRTSCAKACKAARCVISEKPYCAKTGLQAPDMGDANALRRFKEARAYVLHGEVDKRTKE